jgi:hypothetical protein
MEYPPKKLTLIEGTLDQLERDTLKMIWSHAQLYVMDKKLGELKEIRRRRPTLRVIQGIVTCRAPAEDEKQET